MNESYDLGGDVLYEVDDELGEVRSTWPDGKSVNGVYQYTAEDVARARSLGYQGSDDQVCEGMHRDHDLAHHLVMRAVGFDSSVILRRIAEGKDKHPAGLGQLEERLAFLVQRVANEGLHAVARAT